MDHRPDTALLRIGKRVKRISLQRYLLTKPLVELKKVKESDLVCLFENQLWLESKCLKDFQFFRKFGTEVFTVSELLKNLNTSEISLKSISRISKKVAKFIPSFLVPLRNYGQWKSRFAGSFHLNPIASKEIRDFYLPKRPQERRIGVGYRDKGSKRNLAKDGSPDWTEISMDKKFQRSQIEYDVNKVKVEEDFHYIFHKYGLISEKELRDLAIRGVLSEGDPETFSREKGNEDVL
jgi:hypothetical protein